MSYGKDMLYPMVMVLLSAAFLVLAAVLVVFFRKKPPPEEQGESMLPAKLCAQPYSLSDVYAATDGFSRRRVVGEGLRGTVYAAVLDGGELVAVKRIHPHLVLNNAGFGFSSVIKSLSLAHHPHIVPIIGFSEAPGERVVVMEFVGMMNLDFYLHRNPDGGCLLDWSRRVRVAAGAARGLEYLHEGMNPSIVHGCVKASNILIDVKFCARICDYGLTFLAPSMQDNKRGLGGFDHGDGERFGACKESDVLGFGVVLLELLSGRRNDQNGLLVKWALPLIKETRFGEFLDQRLAIPSDVKPLVRMAKVALACVANSRSIRPSIAQVTAILNNLEVEVRL